MAPVACMLGLTEDDLMGAIRKEGKEGRNVSSPSIPNQRSDERLPQGIVSG